MTTCVRAVTGWTQCRHTELQPQPFLVFVFFNFKIETPYVAQAGLKTEMHLLQPYQMTELQACTHMPCLILIIFKDW